MRCALAVIAFALVASGCGSSQPTDMLKSGDETTPPAATPVPGTTVAAEESPSVNEISKASAKPGELVKVSAITPKKFAKAHCEKSIIVVLYQPGAVVDEALYAQARRAAKGRKDLVSLAYTPSDVKQFGDLPTKLGLLSTPGLAIVDRSGRIETFWTSFVDYSLIGYQLDRAAAAKPCKVGSAEAPAAGSALGDAALVANGGTPTSTVPAPASAAATAASLGTPIADPTAVGSDASVAAAAAAPSTLPATSALPVG